MQRQMAEDDLRPLSMGSVMLGQELRMWLHVVVHEQQDLAARPAAPALRAADAPRFRCSSRPRGTGGRASERIGRPVGGPSITTTTSKRCGNS